MRCSTARSLARDVSICRDSRVEILACGFGITVEAGRSSSTASLDVTQFAVGHRTTGKNKRRINRSALSFMDRNGIAQAEMWVSFHVDRDAKARIQVNGDRARVRMNFSYPAATSVADENAVVVTGEHDAVACVKSFAIDFDELIIDELAR